MSYSDTNIVDEIRVVIAQKTERNGDVLNPDWITMQVIDVHVAGFSRGSDFMACCIWSHVRRLVGTELRRWRDDAFYDAQPELDGFGRLQEYYEVESKEGNAVRRHRVRRHLLTLPQRRFIAADLRQKGETMVEHAHQLDRETDELVANGDLTEE